jgi:hypothetical protein
VQPVLPRAVEGGITSKFCDFFHQLPKVKKLFPLTLTGSQNLSYTVRLRCSPTRLLARFKKAAIDAEEKESGGEAQQGFPRCTSRVMFKKLSKNPELF